MQPHERRRSALMFGTGEASAVSGVTMGVYLFRNGGSDSALRESAEQ